MPSPQSTLAALPPGKRPAVTLGKQPEPTPTDAPCAWGAGGRFSRRSKRISLFFRADTHRQSIQISCVNPGRPESGRDYITQKFVEATVLCSPSARRAEEAARRAEEAACRAEAAAWRAEAAAGCALQQWGLMRLARPRARRPRSAAARTREGRQVLRPYRRTVRAPVASPRSRGRYRPWQCRPASSARCR